MIKFLDIQIQLGRISLLQIPESLRNDVSAELNT